MTAFDKVLSGIPEMDKAAGMLRIVADRHRYSQRKLDVLDIEKNELSEIFMEEALPLFSENCKRNLLEHDTDAERQFREQGRRRDIYFISCQGLAKNEEFTKGRVRYLLWGSF